MIPESIVLKGKHKNKIEKDFRKLSISVVSPESLDRNSYYEAVLSNEDNTYTISEIQNKELTLFSPEYKGDIEDVLPTDQYHIEGSTIFNKRQVDKELSKTLDDYNIGHIGIILNMVRDKQEKKEPHEEHLKNSSLTIKDKIELLEDKDFLINLKEYVDSLVKDTTNALSVKYGLNFMDTNHLLSSREKVHFVILNEASGSTVFSSLMDRGYSWSNVGTKDSEEPESTIELDYVNGSYIIDGSIVLTLDPDKKVIYNQRENSEELPIEELRDRVYVVGESLSIDTEYDIGRKVSENDFGDFLRLPKYD